MRRAAVVGIIAIGGLSLAGCTGQTTPATTAPTVSPSSVSPSIPDAGQFTPPPTGLIDEDTGETVTPEQVPEWDDASRAAVIDAAEAAMAAFARPDLDYDTWWGGVEPLLTQAAAEDYAWVDPANIPVTRVTGDGFIVNDTSVYVATVEVPTDAGRYQVLLSRTDATTGWLVERFTPIEDAG
ncbi:MAG: hypothetical protein ACK5LS_11135 [Propioniciclava sp.]